MRAFLPAVLALATASFAARHPVKKPAPPPVDQQALMVQVLLDRAHFSPGQIDASMGALTHLILAAFQSQHGLPASGNPDDVTLQALQQPGPSDQQPATVAYTLSYDDIRGPYAPLPATMAAQAKLPAMNYTSAWDGLGEKFHCSAALLRRLNREMKSLKPGDQITVPNVHRDIPQGTAAILVSKSSRLLEALDSNGKPIATYPATIGSQHDPLPIGDWKVVKVNWNPKFYYDPALFWNANPRDAKEVIQPGPRNPVGVVWISLDKEHYGIHGTPDPAGIGHVTSHGCVRLTNWDAAEIGQMAQPGMPVQFRE
jgi:lipoprotein-anchoring transpeptidase ErfK/SrfK